MIPNVSSTNLGSRITIHYDRKTSNLIMVSGVVLLVLGLKFGLIFYAIGLVLIGRGFLYLKNSCYFSFDDRELTIYGPLGQKIKNYRFDSPTDLKVKNNQIYLQTNSSEKKLPIGKWLIAPDDWRTFMEKTNSV